MISGTDYTEFQLQYTIFFLYFSVRLYFVWNVEGKLLVLV